MFVIHWNAVFYNIIIVKSNLVNLSKALEEKPDKEESDCGNTRIYRIKIKHILILNIASSK